MRNFWRCILINCSAMILIISNAEGQDANRISGDFSGLSFADFVHSVEAKTDFHFYFNVTDLDSVRVNLKASDERLNDILNKIFENTDFHFAIDSLHNVYISKRTVIQTELRPDFFQRTQVQNPVTEESVVIPEPDNVKKLKSSLENRLYEIGLKSNPANKGNATIAGYVKDIRNGEGLIGIAVYVDSSSTGVISDQYGYYSLTLPRGRHLLNISGGGMKQTWRQVLLYSDGKLNIEMEDFIPSLKMVTVSAEKHSNIRGTQMGVIQLNIKTIKQVPAVLGEADILRVVLTLPGVTSVGEGSTGFNVRGGSSDQNLILFNDATIYNPSHLFGFFSAFNSDVVKGVELYKSAIPEKYGGRLSSVLDVTTRDGNNKKFSGIGGIGPLTSKLTLEGPIIKEKTSFIIGGRTTYSNWILKNLPNAEYRNSKASFYDLDLHINHTINNKNNLYLTWYMSNDEFKLNNDTLYKYGNKNISLKWKHNFNNKFYGVASGGYDHYQYAISGSHDINAFRMAFDINQANFRTDFVFSPNVKHSLDFGVNTIHYKLHPGSFEPIGKESLVIPDKIESEQALESAVYLGDRYNINDKVSINAGLRYSMFNYLGPHDVYQYIKGYPRENSTLLDTVRYASGKTIKTYHGPEVRLAMRYALSDNSSVKMSFNSLRQYIHMLSNTTAISPTDIWKLSDPNIKPQRGYQASIGYYQNFKSDIIETSFEIYYKKLENYLDYKSGAELTMNHHIETDVINTRGKAYGAEIMLKKVSGKLNGWVNYTFSRTWLKMDDSLSGEMINHGEYYPASFDKPHNVNFIGNYRFSHRVSMSLNIIYTTGRPITLPIAVFNLGGSQRLLYSDRNQYRIPDYFRVDFSMNFEGNHKIKQLKHNSWSVGVYNLTGRKNAYSVFFVEQNGIINGYKLSIFGTLIPFVTYNFRF